MQVDLLRGIHAQQHRFAVLQQPSSAVGIDAVRGVDEMRCCVTSQSMPFAGPPSSSAVRATLRSAIQRPTNPCHVRLTATRVRCETEQPLSASPYRPT